MRIALLPCLTTSFGLLFVVHILIIYIDNVAGFNGYLSQPMTRQDFRQVSELLYDCFDEEEESNNLDNTNINSNQIKEKSSLFPFVSTVSKIKRMMGILRLENDYSLRAAKARRRKYAQVVYRANDGSIVGVAEVGIAGLPTPSSLLSKSEEGQVKRVPTLGNLAVKKEVRRQGIATELLDKCEEIVSRSWNDTELFVAVQKNSPARALYGEKCGYHLFNGEEVVDIPIRQGFFGEENRHHIIYYKNLTSRAFDKNKINSNQKNIEEKYDKE